jgi:hypothetical protein
MLIKKKILVPILISNKVDFKTRSIIRDKDGDFFLIGKGIKLQTIAILNVYVLNNRASKNLKQT